MSATPNLPEVELLRLIGRGTFCDVYHGRVDADGRDVAVKLLRAEWTDDAEAQQLLRRESAIAGAVTHPHLVRLELAHVARPPLFLAYELLLGETLRERLRRDFRLDGRAALFAVRQAAEALAALHRAGFLHADVKPDNIFWCAGGMARLIDLGLPRL